MIVTGCQNWTYFWSNHSFPLERISKNLLMLPRPSDITDRKSDDRREEEEHDEVIDRYLHQRVRRIPVGELRPDEHHCRSRCCGKDDGSRNVLVGKRLTDEGKEQMFEEEGGDQRHGERLDEPVDEERDEYPLRPFAHPENTGEIDLEHHRVDHQPDQYGDRHIDLAPLPEFEPRRRPVIPGSSVPRATPASMQSATQTVR